MFSDDFPRVGKSNNEWPPGGHLRYSALGVGCLPSDLSYVALAEWEASAKEGWAFGVRCFRPRAQTSPAQSNPGKGA